MDAERLFDDPSNPTEAEVTAWAYGPTTEVWLMEDWDLIVARPSFGSRFLTIAADPTCPKRQFILGCLYLLAGDAIRSQYNTMPRHELVGLVEDARLLSEPWVTTWAERTATLINDPVQFQYEEWCDGGLARVPLEP